MGFIFGIILKLPGHTCVTTYKALQSLQRGIKRAVQSTFSLNNLGPHSGSIISQSNLHKNIQWEALTLFSSVVARNPQHEWERARLLGQSDVCLRVCACECRPACTGPMDGGGGRGARGVGIFLVGKEDPFSSTVHFHSSPTTTHKHLLVPPIAHGYLCFID